MSHASEENPLSDHRLRVLGNLLAKIEETKALSPTKAICLSHKGFADVLSMIVTMIVVLMQFRASE